MYINFFVLINLMLFLCAWTICYPSISVSISVSIIHFRGSHTSLVSRFYFDSFFTFVSVSWLIYIIHLLIYVPFHIQTNICMLSPHCRRKTQCSCSANLKQCDWATPSSKVFIAFITFKSFDYKFSAKWLCTVEWGKKFFSLDITIRFRLSFDGFPLNIPFN